MAAPDARRTAGRVPYVQQVTAADCGAACLAMVLRYYGRAVRLDALRGELEADRDGETALGLLNAAERHGLRARGVRVEIEDLQYLAAATILHWNFNHFVVFERLHRDGVDIVDPTVGQRRIGMDEFRRAFTGVALVLEPTERFEPLRAGSARFWLFLRHAIGPGLLWSRILVTSVLLQLFALAVPIATGLLVDRIVPRADVDLLALLGVGLLALVVFQGLAALIRAHLLVHLRTRIEARLTMGFLEHLVALPYVFFQRRSAGDLLMRLNSHAVVRELLTSSALSALLDGVLVALSLLILLAADATIGALVAALGVLQVVVFAAARPRQRRLMMEGLQAQARTQSYEFEMLAGIETLKAVGAEERSIQGWSDLFVGTLNVSFNRGRLQAAVDAALSTLRLASPLLVLGVGAMRVLGGDLSLGGMLALSVLASGVLVPLSALVATAMQLQLLGTYFERIDDVLVAAPEQDRASVRPAPPLRGGIRIERLAFSYGGGTPAVRDVDADIAPGQLVAIVGRSGAGKSTLASLLVGLYVPTSGRILYDGADLSELDLRTVRRQIGVVTQRPYLFGASIRANITLADPAVPLDAVIEAATLARIHDEIAAMPLGYETFLADGGASLAGGQRQRLAIARALVRRPAVLLLDEATSALDAVTETEIHAALAALRCTRVVIAHRLSTIMRADLILMMDEGRIVERGTHRDLLARGGVYATLVRAQAEAASEVP